MPCFEIITTFAYNIYHFSNFSNFSSVANRSFITSDCIVVYSSKDIEEKLNIEHDDEYVLKKHGVNHKASQTKRICITKAKNHGHWVRDRVQAVLSHPPKSISGGDLRCVA